MMVRTQKALVKLFVRAFLCLSVVGMLAACSREPDFNDPAVVYNTYCFACHDTGAAGAPLLSDQAFWQAAAKDKARLYQNTLKGVGAMPKKGTCFSCSDQQLQQTVDWMLQQP